MESVTAHLTWLEPAGIKGVKGKPFASQKEPVLRKKMREKNAPQEEEKMWFESTRGLNLKEQEVKRR